LDRNIDEILQELQGSGDLVLDLESIVESEKQLDFGFFKSKEMQNIIKYTCFTSVKEDERILSNQNDIKFAKIEATESQKKLDFIILMIKKHEEKGNLKEH
jgi:hypothetical protein